MSLPDIRRRKAETALAILVAGIVLANIWTCVMGVALARDFPYDTFLGRPSTRFTDFTNLRFTATLPNPYIDPICFYPPTAFVLLRLLPSSDVAGVTAVIFMGLASLALLFTRLLWPLVPGPWKRTGLAFFLPLISYPVLAAAERGNLEIVVAPLIAWAIYHYDRSRFVMGTAFLVGAAWLKLYPALLLVLLLRRGKYGLAAMGGLIVLVTIAAAFFCFPAPGSEVWHGYREDLGYYRDAYVLQNCAIEGAGSPWNTFKITLLGLGWLGLIPHVSFSFDGPFIGAMYHVYAAGFALFSLVCVAYAWFWEKQDARAAVLLLLLISIAAPGGADYRLMYASLALAGLVLLRGERPGDRTAVVLVALAVVPMKEILLTFAGRTENNVNDVSLLAWLSPILILTAMAVLLYRAWRHRTGGP